MQRAITIQLPTGELELQVDSGDYTLDELLGFAARANARRGFLFLSKVLGKHWPVTPARMRGIHEHMAAAVPGAPGPVVFIAMAETAIGLGQGVFEAWLCANPGRPALFIHSTRYRVGTGDLIEFEEAHSHAPRQFLHLPPPGLARELLTTATTLVLVDDEASTGNTFLNLTHACRKLNPHIERVHLAAITNFMGEAASAGLSGRIKLPVTIAAPLSGTFRFTPGQPAGGGAPAQRFEADADRGASTRFGRLGLTRAVRIPPDVANAIASTIAPGESVLVLGTGEFMHCANLLGHALEERGLPTSVQSTTRSPILTWGAVDSALSFPDNYGEGIANYLYNVGRGQYRHVLICHETPPNAALYQLARELGGRLFHFRSASEIEEVPVC